MFPKKISIYNTLIIAVWYSAGFECGRSRVQSSTRTVSYQRRNKNGTSSSLVWHSTLKGKYWLFLKN